jgi:hypothetical protein
MNRQHEGRCLVMCVLSLVQDGWRVVREKISSLMVFDRREQD